MIRPTLAFVGGLLVVAGCLPRDPEGTTQRVRGGTLRAGITDNSPWTRYRDDKASGIEADLVEAFATSLGARVAWTQGAEGLLLQALHRGDLDLVVGGLTDSNPWSQRVAFTRPYATVGDDKHVLAVPPGENRWLLEMDRFLQQRRAEVRARFAEEVER